MGSVASRCLGSADQGQPSSDQNALLAGPGATRVEDDGRNAVIGALKPRASIGQAAPRQASVSDVLGPTPRMLSLTTTAGLPLMRTAASSTCIPADNPVERLCHATGAGLAILDRATLSAGLKQFSQPVAVLYVSYVTPTPCTSALETANSGLGADEGAPPVPDPGAALAIQRNSHDGKVCLVFSTEQGSTAMGCVLANAAAVTALKLRDEQDLLAFLARSFTKDPSLKVLFQDIVKRLLHGQLHTVSHFVPGDFGHNRYFLSMRISPFAYRCEGEAPQHNDGALHGSSRHIHADRLRCTQGSIGSPRAGEVNGLTPAIILELDVPYEGKELAARLQRDYMIISNIPSIVTMFDMAGRVLHQNRSSLAYMGYLVGMEPDCAPPGVRPPPEERRTSTAASAGGLRYGPFGVPPKGWNYTPAVAPRTNRMQQLFSHDPAKLQEIMQAMFEGTEWRGLVRMPSRVQWGALSGDSDDFDAADGSFVVSAPMNTSAAVCDTPNRQNRTALSPTTLPPVQQQRRIAVELLCELQATVTVGAAPRCRSGSLAPQTSPDFDPYSPSSAPLQAAPAPAGGTALSAAREHKPSALPFGPPVTGLLAATEATGQDKSTTSAPGDFERGPPVGTSAMTALFLEPPGKLDEAAAAAARAASGADEPPLGTDGAAAAAAPPGLCQPPETTGEGVYKLVGMERQGSSPVRSSRLPVSGRPQAAPGREGGAGTKKAERQVHVQDYRSSGPLGKGTCSVPILGVPSENPGVSQLMVPVLSAPVGSSVGGSSPVYNKAPSERYSSFLNLTVLTAASSSPSPDAAGGSANSALATSFQALASLSSTGDPAVTMRQVPSDYDPALALRAPSAVMASSSHTASTAAFTIGTSSVEGAELSANRGAIGSCSVATGSDSQALLGSGASTAAAAPPATVAMAALAAWSQQVVPGGAAGPEQPHLVAEGSSPPTRVAVQGRGPAIGGPEASDEFVGVPRRQVAPVVPGRGSASGFDRQCSDVLSSGSQISPQGAAVNQEGSFLLTTDYNFSIEFVPQHMRVGSSLMAARSITNQPRGNAPGQYGGVDPSKPLAYIDEETADDDGVEELSFLLPKVSPRDCSLVVPPPQLPPAMPLVNPAHLASTKDSMPTTSPFRDVAHSSDRAQAFLDDNGTIASSSGAVLSMASRQLSPAVEVPGPLRESSPMLPPQEDVRAKRMGRMSLPSLNISPSLPTTPVSSAIAPPLDSRSQSGGLVSGGLHSNPAGMSRSLARDPSSASSSRTTTYLQHTGLGQGRRLRAVLKALVNKNDAGGGGGAAAAAASASSNAVLNPAWSDALARNSQSITACGNGSAVAIPRLSSDLVGSRVPWAPNVSLAGSMPSPAEVSRLQSTQQDDGRWHEVLVRPCFDPMSSEPLVMVIQTDVTSKVRAEELLARVLEAEHRLLADIFPRHVVQYMTQQRKDEAELERNGLMLLRHIQDPAAVATMHDSVTVLFADIKGFTEMSKAVPAGVVMTFLNDLYTRFDSLTDVYGVYKVETIGDCYMVAGGLVARDIDGYGRAVRGQGDTDPLHAMRVVAFARAMLEEAAKVQLPNTGKPVQVRVGMHSGSVMSGVVGQKMPRFCLFGDTINTASRMESTGRPGAIHVSSVTRRMLPPEEDAEVWAATGGVEVKGKGRMDTFLWLPESPGAGRQRRDKQQRAMLLGTLSTLHATSTSPSPPSSMRGRNAARPQSGSAASIIRATSNTFDATSTMC